MRLIQIVLGPEADPAPALAPLAAFAPDLVLMPPTQCAMI